MPAETGLICTVESVISTLFALLGNRFQGFDLKAAPGPLEGQVLETGTG
jgi:hypothetical protein